MGYCRGIDDAQLAWYFSLLYTHDMRFELVGEITAIEIIAVNRGIDELARLQRSYGRGRWRKMKGNALIRRPDGTVVWAELYWYEAYGIGRKEFKVKRVLE